jgi:predicted CoA-binding protein
MDNTTYAEAKQILESAKTMLLVDWPNPGIPRALLQAGFTVFSYSPNHYSQAKLVAEPPQEITPQNIFPPRNNNDKGYLIFQKIEDSPDLVDIVSIFRPDEELAEIISKHTLPMKAKTLWIQPPGFSVLAPNLAKSHGLALIQNYDIAEIAGQIGKI